MRNYYDEDDDYDYSPNELARLSSTHREKYNQIVKSNLSDGDTVKKWEERNKYLAKDFLAQQRRNRR